MSDPNPAPPSPGPPNRGPADRTSPAGPAQPSPGPANPAQPNAGQPDPDQPQPGPLGWLELTFQIMRDRSHSNWMFLKDGELLAKLREKGTVAAYIPGAEVGTPDLAVVRVAVSPEGHVVVARPGHAPEPGDLHVQEWLPTLLDELKTVANIEADQVGPPWLPVADIVEAANRPTDSRKVYCYRGTDTITAAAFARQLQAPLTVYRADGWIIAASEHNPKTVIIGPPNRVSRAFPYATLERKGHWRSFAWAKSAKGGEFSVVAQASPPLRPVSLKGAHPDTKELMEWLADPGVWERNHAEGPPPDAEVPAETTREQHATILRWMQRPVDSGFLTEVAEAFEIPAIAAQLVETPAGQPDPEGGEVIEPAPPTAMMSRALREQDTEPDGRMPWHALSRVLYRRPVLGLALGAVELLAAAALVWLVLATDLGWWVWIVVAALAISGLGHVFEALLRLRWRRSEASPPAD